MTFFHMGRDSGEDHRSHCLPRDAGPQRTHPKKQFDEQLAAAGIARASFIRCLEVRHT